jgi:glutathione S-transferase
VRIAPPSEIGGLQSPEYLALNPQGKMPTMQCTEAGFSIPESDTICRYLLSTFADIGPSFQPDNWKSNLLCRFHDLYLTTIQGCMYKADPPFGVYSTRKDALTEFDKQLKVIEDLVEGGTAYICGPEVSLADATLYPTMVFAKHMMPKFGFERALPPKIDAWFEGVRSSDEVFQKVFDEVSFVNCFSSPSLLPSSELMSIRTSDPQQPNKLGGKTTMGLNLASWVQRRSSLDYIRQDYLG